MPIIKIWGIPERMTEERLKILCDSIVSATESITELGLAGKDAVTVLFPSDRLKHGLGEEVIAEIAIFAKPERTDDVRAKLAEKIGVLLHGNFPNAKIECFVYPLERASGFWKIDPRPKITQPEQ